MGRVFDRHVDAGIILTVGASNLVIMPGGYLDYYDAIVVVLVLET